MHGIIFEELKKASFEKGSELTLSSTTFPERFAQPPHSKTPELISLEELEKQHILRVLEATGGNRTRAARMLGIDLTTLRRKLNKFSDPSNRAK